jgi:translation initiation factor 2B subunit (eIF-2B alpha/beta/delta family)
MTTVFKNFSDNNQAIEKIRNDNISGANELDGLTRKAILSFISTPNSNKTLLNFLKKLKSAKPEMAPIMNTVDKVVKIAKTSKDIKLRNEKIKKMISAPDIDWNTLTKNVTKVMKGKTVVLTYSYSSTIIEVLIPLSGTRLTVFVPESRPVNEGRNMAIKLKEAGLKIKFITDAGISKFIKDVDIILLGADSFSKEFVINKIGTLGIALLAREYKIPCYVICGKNKFSNISLNETAKNPKEIWDIKGIEVKNFYFEEIPVKYFNGIITDKK